MLYAVQVSCQVAKSLISLRLVCGMVIALHYGMPIAWPLWHAYCMAIVARRLHGVKLQAIKSPALRPGGYYV